MKNKTVVFRAGTKGILRPLIESDVPFLMQWMNDLDVTQFLRTILPVSLQSEMEWFEKVSKQSSDSVTLAMVDKKTKALIGVISLGNIDHRQGTATTGTSIGNKKYWGKGYGTEAKMLLLEYAFRELNLRKIYSDVIGYNERSLAYAKKCGYVEEARLPQHYYRKGQYWDKIVLAVYRDEWEKLWKEFSKTLKK